MCRIRPCPVSERRRIGSHDRVGQIRQRGLAVGVPILDENGSEDGGYETRDDAVRICHDAIDRSRVLLRPLGNIITICPPLNIESDQIEDIVTALERGLEVLEKPADE